MDRVVLAFSKDETANKIKMMLDGSAMMFTRFVTQKQNF